MKINALKMIIGGALVDSPERLDVINPANAEVFANCPRANEDILEQAIQAAQDAFPAWSAQSVQNRRQTIMAFADALEARFEDLVQLLVLEQGKPMAEAQYEVGGSIGILRGYSQMDIPAKLLRDQEDTKIIQYQAPLGVVAVITPWNFPLMLLASKLAPAFIMGNCVVAKPAPTTPLTTLLVGEISKGILPDGVLNVIVDNNDLGEKLTAHPGIDKIAFTGSSRTGKIVMRNAAGSLKHLTLELGGNDAALVLDDVDVEKLAPEIFNAAMMNAGQVCTAAKRIYVPEALYEPLCNALAEIAENTIVGPGDNADTQIGPLQNLQQFERVKDLIKDSQNTGRIIAGGTFLNGPGYFVRPTIVCDISDDARIVKEEQFGPIVPVLSYKNLDDVIMRINDSEYGLAGTIWTSNPERAIEIAHRINTGTVWVNKFMDMQIDVPFGGAKQSGIGAELGIEGLSAYTQTRIINAAL